MKPLTFPCQCASQKCQRLLQIGEIDTTSSAGCDYDYLPIRILGVIEQDDTLPTIWLDRERALRVADELRARAERMHT